LRTQPICSRPLRRTDWAEGEQIVGDLVRRADRLGLDAPMMRAALCNLQIYEARRQSPSAASPRFGD
jgi:ketopantoate reductase